MPKRGGTQAQGGGRLLGPTGIERRTKRLPSAATKAKWASDRAATVKAQGDREKRLAAHLSQDGTTNVNRPGGIGGGSTGKRTATPKAVTHSSTATHAAFRDTEAITARKNGAGSVTTRHNGRNWSIKVTDANYRQVHHASGRSSTPEAALNRLVKEYKKYS